MTKVGILNSLNNLKLESEQKSLEELETMHMQIIDALLEYINDHQIRQAVDDIHF